MKEFLQAKGCVGVGKMDTPSKTILLVEDEEAIRRLFVFVLGPYGFTLLEASNGMEAIRIAEGYDGPIDLLVTDLDMPKLGGAELAKRLEAMRPGLKIIFLSGVSQDAAIRPGYLNSLNPEATFLQKPISPSHLVKTVRQKLGEEWRA